jgi:tetratricopeptide (TPR) repeat protein
MNDRFEKLQHMFSANPNDSFLKFALALEYLKAGNKLKAVELFQSIVENDPGYTGVYYHLGKLQAATGNIDSAVTTWKQGLELTRMKDQKTYHEIQQALMETTGEEQTE